MRAFHPAVSFESLISRLLYTRSTCTAVVLLYIAMMHLFPDACRDFPGPAIRNSVLQIFVSFTSTMVSAVFLRNNKSTCANSSRMVFNVIFHALLYFLAKVLIKCLSVKGSKTTSYLVDFMRIFLGYECIRNNLVILSI